VIFDLCDRWERDLYYLAIRDLDFYAGRREGLGRLHAPHGATYPPAISRNDLDVIFTVKWLQSRECLGNFHRHVLLDISNMPFQKPEVYRTGLYATGKHDLAYRTLSVYSSG
jgi:hypothetical protein